MRVMTGMLLIVLAGDISLAVASNGEIQVRNEQALGRVFLTVAQRRRLDERRAAGPADHGPAGPDQTAASAPPTRTKRAAGYIVVPSGARSTWRDGDFHVTDSSLPAQPVNFPGRVSIAVHDAPTPPVEEFSDTVQDQDTPVSTIPPGDRE